MLICWGYRRPLPPPNTAQPQRTLPRLRASYRRRSTNAGAYHVIYPFQAWWFVSASSRTTDDALVGDRRNCQQCGARTGRNPGATSDTLASAANTLRVLPRVPRGVMVSHGNLLENSEPHQPGLRGYAGHRIRDMATGFP